MALIIKLFRPKKLRNKSPTAVSSEATRQLRHFVWSASFCQYICMYNVHIYTRKIRRERTFFQFPRDASIKITIRVRFLARKPRCSPRLQLLGYSQRVCISHATALNSPSPSSRREKKKEAAERKKPRRRQQRERDDEQDEIKGASASLTSAIHSRFFLFASAR